MEPSHEKKNIFAKTYKCASETEKKTASEELDKTTLKRRKFLS